MAPARRSPSPSTIDGRLSLGLFEPDSAGRANLQVDRAYEPRPCPEPSVYRRAALSDARLPGRSSASEAVGEIALWRVPGTCAICASAEIAGALHTHRLHGTPIRLQPLSGQCMGCVLHAWFASAGTFTTFDRAHVACRIVARIVLACPVCCNIIACDCR